MGTNGEILIGLRTSTECGSTALSLSNGCTEMSNSDYVTAWRGIGGTTTSAAFAPCGTVTLIAALAAALGLLGAAIVGLLKTKPNLPFSPSSLSMLGIMISVVSGCIFVATKPGPAGYVGVGISFWIFGIGAVAGIAAALMLVKVNRPLDPDLMDDAMNPDNF